MPKNTKKEPTVKDLKAMAFDIDQQMKQLQQRYNQVVQDIVKKQQEKKVTKKKK